MDNRDINIKNIFIPLLLMITLLAIGCSGGDGSSLLTGGGPRGGAIGSSGSGTGGWTSPGSGIIEGDTGIFYRDGTECFGPDAQPVSGSLIYVSPLGSDLNTGTSQSSPFKTLAKALCNVAPGQTVYLLPGTYSDSVIMGNFGDGVSVITISGVNENNVRPVLDGNSTRTYGIAVSDSRGIIVENIHFTNFTDAGLYIALTNAVTIENNVFSRNGFNSIGPDYSGEGFGLMVSDVINFFIKNNESYENGPNPSLVAQGILGTGIDTYNVENGQISANTSHHNTGGGILVEDGINVTVSNNEIYGNMLWGDYWDAGIWLDGGYNVMVTGNNIHDNKGPAIQASDSELRYPYGSCKYTITGNTLTNNYWALYTYNMLKCPLPSSSYLTFTNNTTSNNSYPGSIAEYVNGTSDELLCLLWPCGQNTPCVQPPPNINYGKMLCQ